MVDVTEKDNTVREASAEGKILVSRDVFQGRQIREHRKRRRPWRGGDGGDHGSKAYLGNDSHVHILPLTNCRIHFDMDENECSILCTCTVKVTGKNGCGDGGADRGERGSADYL